GGVDHRGVRGRVARDPVEPQVPVTLQRPVLAAERVEGDAGVVVEAVYRRSDAQLQPSSPVLLRGEAVRRGVQRPVADPLRGPGGEGRQLVRHDDPVVRAYVTDLALPAVAVALRPARPADLEVALARHGDGDRLLADRAAVDVQ